MGHHDQPFRQCFALPGGQVACVATRRSWFGRRAAGLGLRRSNGEEGRDCNHEGSLHTGNTIPPSRTGAIGKRKQVLVSHQSAAVNWTSCLIWNRWIRIAAKDTKQKI